MARSEAIAQASAERVAARLDRLPMSPWHVGMFVICAVGLLCDATDQLVIISIAPLLIREWAITPFTIGLVIAGGNIGGVVGAFVFGLLADRIGRRTCMIACIVIYTCLTGLAALAQNAPELIAIRAIGGFGLGGCVPVTLAFVGEFAPPRWRGRLVAWWNSMFAFGLTLAGLVGVFVVVPFGWRWGFVVGTAPLLLVVFVVRYLPESVRFLLAKGRIEEAVKTVERVERAVLGPTEAAAVAAAERRAPSPAPTSAAGAAVRRLAGWRALAILVAPRLRHSMIACAVLWFLPAAALLSSFYPIILAQSRGLGTRSAIALVTASTVLGPAGQFIAGFLSDWMGRKRTLTLALALLAVAPLGAFEIAQSQRGVFVFLTLTFIATSALYGALFGYTPEQLPTAVRGSGLGFFEGTRRLGGVVGPPAVGAIYTYAGLTPVLWGAFAACCVSAVVLIALGRETSGTSLSDTDALVT